MRSQPSSGLPRWGIIGKSKTRTLGRHCQEEGQPNSVSQGVNSRHVITVGVYWYRVRLLFSQCTLIWTCPTVAVSERVTAGISLVKYNDPSVFILVPPKPVTPPVLLTVQPCLIVHRCTLLTLMFCQTLGHSNHHKAYGDDAFR